jgi:RimJ/RimL family protein N-acetyltransferase
MSAGGTEEPGEGVEPGAGGGSLRAPELELVGERVRLRPHRGDDAREAFALLAGRDEILRWLLWDGPGSIGELVAHYREWWSNGGDGPELRLALEERASGALAGSLSLRFTGHPGQGDLGYWVGEPYQRRGLAREAIALCARLAFRHLGAQSLYAWVFVDNLASRRVLERNGFTLARTVPARILKRGRRVDEWHFVLLASEWRRLGGARAPAPEVEIFRPGAADARNPSLGAEPDSPTGPQALG